MNNMMQKRNKQGGFTFMELMIALIIFIIAVALVILATQGFFTKAKGTTLDVDLHDVQTGVGSYATASSLATGKAIWPTSDGQLPAAGNASIDFHASFVNDNGDVTSFYPHFISKLPRHWDEGVWQIDSTGKVSVNMNRDDY
jgi:type II secretory pathway pseudopilin PulG